MFNTILPKSIKVKLFGHREKFGKSPWPGDKDWDEWLVFYYTFYKDTQKGGISKIVNHYGYKLMKTIDLENKVILEIGPGDLPHQIYWINKPEKYVVCDIRREFILQSQKILDNQRIVNSGYVLDQPRIPLDDSSIDVVIGFYVLEHLYPLETYLQEIVRVLKPGGLLVAGIPTEGGLAWGLGRFFSSRRYIKKYSDLDPDKIICWEHPNFAQEVLTQLDYTMIRKQVKFWPLFVPLVDMNLLIRLVYQKR